MNEKYTKIVLEPIVLESDSVNEVIRKLGKRFSGGLHGHLSSKIKTFGICTDHFTGRACRKGKSPTNKRPWQDILVKRSFGAKEDTSRLRRALIESGREYKCEECNGKAVWNNKPLCIQIDHKDGNWLNNFPDNLRFMCPNCHSQTNTFGFKNSKIATVA
jgi:hypothetical protein